MKNVFYNRKLLIVVDWSTKERGKKEIRKRRGLNWKMWCSIIRREEIEK